MSGTVDGKDRRCFVQYQLGAKELIMQDVGVDSSCGHSKRFLPGIFPGVNGKQPTSTVFLQQQCMNSPLSRSGTTVRVTVRSHGSLQNRYIHLVDNNAAAEFSSHCSCVLVL